MVDKDTQLPAEDKPSPLITDLLPAQEVHNLYMQEMKISSELNKEIKKVREYLFDNFGEFSEAKILSYQNGEKHTVDLVKIVVTEYTTKLHRATEYLNLLLSAQLCDLKAPDHLINEIKTFLDGTK
jgi:hypothetical protein